MQRGLTAQLVLPGEISAQSVPLGQTPAGTSDTPTLLTLFCWSASLFVTHIPTLTKSIFHLPASQCEAKHCSVNDSLMLSKTLDQILLPMRWVR